VKLVFFLCVSDLFLVVVSCAVLNLRLSLLFWTNPSTFAEIECGVAQIVISAWPVTAVIFNSEDFSDEFRSVIWR